MKKVGLLGGTFDPPHIGHFQIAEDAYQAMALDEVWFIPSQIPPHKADAKVGADIRVAMLKSVINDIPYFKINNLELKRKGKSYTIDTIKELKSTYPDISFYFIIGADMVEYLPKWYKIDELMQLIPFIGVQRPQFSLSSSYPVTFIDSVAIDLSSSAIRERLSHKQSIQFLVPHQVYQMIKEQNLYE